MSDPEPVRMRMGRAQRWAWHLLVALITAVLASLGFWQISRHDESQERNALLVERLAADPRPYAELTAELDPDAAEGAPLDARNRPVVTVGRFDPAHEVLLRGHSYENQPGYHVLTPLIIEVEAVGEVAGDAAAGDGAGADGSAEDASADDAGARADGGAGAGTAAGSRVVLVDRGWVPYRVEGPGRPEFAPSADAVRVTGRLMPEADPPEGFLAGLAPRDPPTGPLDEVARADTDRLEEQMPYALDPYLIEAESIAPAGAASDGGVAGDAEAAKTVEAAGSDGEAEEDGTAVRGVLPVLPPRPGPEAGPHVGYAIQWFAFALTASVGYLLLIRRR